MYFNKVHIDCNTYKGPVTCNIALTFVEFPGLKLRAIKRSDDWDVQLDENPGHWAAGKDLDQAVCSWFSTHYDIVAKYLVQPDDASQGGPEIADSDETQ